MIRIDRWILIPIVSGILVLIAAGKDTFANIVGGFFSTFSELSRSISGAIIDLVSTGGLPSVCALVAGSFAALSIRNVAPPILLKRAVASISAGSAAAVLASGSFGDDVRTSVFIGLISFIPVSFFIHLMIRMGRPHNEPNYYASALGTWVVIGSGIWAVWFIIFGG